MGFACFSAGYWDSENPGPVPPLPAALGCRFQRGALRLPGTLPENALLVLDDREIYAGDRPEAIAGQLKKYLEENRCRGLLLDFEQEPAPASLALVQALEKALPCPIYASPPYASDTSGVFLPPLPLTQKLTDYGKPWRGRELLLDLALQRELFAVDEAGCHPLPWEDNPCPFIDETLHVHYGVRVEETRILFTLKREKSDLAALSQEAQSLGIHQGITLYSELGLMTL